MKDAPFRDFADRHAADMTPERAVLLAEVIEQIRKTQCQYGPESTRCDCKYMVEHQGARLHHGEHSGCPELREAVYFLTRWAKGQGEEARLRRVLTDLLNDMVGRSPSGVPSVKAPSWGAVHRAVQVVGQDALTNIGNPADGGWCIECGWTPNAKEHEAWHAGRPTDRTLGGQE